MLAFFFADNDLSYLLLIRHFCRDNYEEITQILLALEALEYQICKEDIYLYSTVLSHLKSIIH